MIIKRLELHGFKSFSDRIKLAFHPGITAIIGPNGTGKSNIVDALLWVLRGRRVKALRGDRSGDVIFNGNSQRAPMGMGEVNLILSNEDEELTISHRVFRSGENEYRMDGKAVRLMDIQDALWKNAIGETEYFVVEQGSIGNFLTSKPLEKRNLMEEAAGTAFYKDKRRQAENKLNTSEQNLTRLEDIISEVTKSKNSLQRQAQAANRYRKLRGEIRELTLALYRRKISSLETSMQHITQHYQKSRDVESEFLSRIKAEDKVLAEKRKQVWTFEKNLKQDQEKLYSLKSQYSRLESEKEREERRIEFFEDNRRKSVQNRHSLEKELEELKKTRADNKTQIEALKKEERRKQEQLQKVDQAQQQARDELTLNQKAIETLRDDYYQKVSSQTEIKNQEARLEKELELNRKQVDKTERELKTEKVRLQENETGKERLLAQRKQIKENREIKQKEHDRMGKKQNELEASLNELNGQLSQLQKTRDGHSHHLHTLEKLVQKEKEQQQDASLPDSPGLLAELMDSDRDHARLVDIFLNEETHSRLVSPEKFLQHLEEKNLKGRFFLQHPEGHDYKANPAVSDPRAHGFLKAHIRPGDNLKKSFPQLPDAVIVSSLIDAVDLWVQHPEMNYVTLSGDILLTSGMLMAGEKKEGLFALTQDIKALKETIAGIDEKLKPLQKRRDETRAAKQETETRITQAEQELAQLTRDNDSIDKELSFSKSESEKIQSHIDILIQEKEFMAEEEKRIKQKKDQLDTSIRDLGREEESLKEKVKQAEDKLEILQKESEQKRQHYFELRSALDVLKERILNLERRIQDSEKREQESLEKIDELAQEIDRSEKEKTGLKEKVHTMGEQLRKINEDVKDQENRLNQEESKFHHLQREQQEQEKKLESLREKHEAAKEERIKWEIKKAEKERDLVNCEESCWQELKKGIDEIKKEVSLDEATIQDVESQLDEAKEKLQRIGSVNLMAEEEYQSQKERFDFLMEQKQDLTDSIASTKEAIRKIDQESKTQFLKALTAVNQNFQDIFSILFEGGSAQIKLTDEEDPLESGIEVIAQPPGKRVQNLALLSGGEKSLTSLAFFFALFRYKPAPFCILDEVDAALDENNLVRFLNLMKKIKHRTQFIIVTHNFKTMEVADYIYGTTMSEPNITNVYSVKLKGGKAIKES